MPLKSHLFQLEMDSICLYMFLKSSVDTWAVVESIFKYPHSHVRYKDDDFKIIWLNIFFSYFFQMSWIIGKKKMNN